MPTRHRKVRPRAVGRRLKAVARVVRSRSTEPVIGVVDEVRRQLLAGWVWLPRGSDPVKVELLMGGMLVTTTYTTPQPAVGRRRRAPAGRRGQAQVSGPFRAPPGSLRHADGGEIHTFSFRLAALWSYARRSTRVRVRVNGRPLPIASHGMYVSPPVDGTHSPQALAELLDRGYVLNQRGQLALPKTLDLEWQHAVSRLYARIRAVLAEEHGLDVFLVYGSLLGAVREGGPIGHDDDLDVAYVSDLQEGPAAADELARVAHELEQSLARFRY
jgi:hypothetical protein